ncbi:DUF11 domain-containing protein [Bacillus cereus]
METNVFVTSINSAILSAVKTTNTAFANIGDTITYTVLIQNNGNTNATNVNFSDMVPAGTTFVENSFTVNGSSLPGANQITELISEQLTWWFLNRYFPSHCYINPTFKSDYKRSIYSIRIHR